jgi:hypothetical protein
MKADREFVRPAVICIDTIILHDVASSDRTAHLDVAVRNDVGKITADVQSAKLKQLLGQIKQS